MNEAQIHSKKLDKVLIKTAILQILAQIITCSIGIYMNIKEMYFQQFFLVPFYIILLLGVLYLNKRWLNKIY